jgi:CPA2 family monovalent cation:H+ antiporter-2
MGDALIALGGAFLAAGLFARLGSRVGLPTIPFFMAAGILFGPNTPGIILVENPADLELFAAVALIMLLFHLGLEFSLRDLIDGGPRLVGAGAIYLALNVGGGFLFGFALGWGLAEALVIAGAVGISSSAIVTKVLIDLERLANPETRLILGIHRGRGHLSGAVPRAASTRFGSGLRSSRVVRARGARLSVPRGAVLDRPLRRALRREAARQRG